MQLPGPARILVKSFLRLVLFLIFVGIPGALFYVKVWGIGFGWPERIAEALSIGPLETKIDRLSFDLLQGLVAEGVQIHSSESQGRQIAEVRRVAVSLNLSALVSGNFLVDKIRLDDTSAKIPLAAHGESPASSVAVERFQADIVFLDNQLHVTEMAAEIQGVRIRGSGVFKNPSQFKIRPPEKDRPGSTPDLGRIADFFAGLKYSGQRPLVTFEFKGDFADPSGLEISPLTIHSGPVAGDGWRLESLEADARFADLSFYLDRLVIHDEKGCLRVWATMQNRLLTFEADSSIDPTQFLKLLTKAKEIRDLSLITPPKISFQGSADLNSPIPEVSATGAFEFGNFAFRGVNVEGLLGDFAWKNGRIFLRDTRLLLGGDEARADVLSSPGDFRIRAVSSLKPTALAPLLDDKAREMLSKMEFRDSPNLQVTLRGPTPNFKSLTGNGSIQLGRTAMRDVWIDRANSLLEIGGGAVTYKDIALHQGSGLGRGTFTYDFAGQQVRLDNIVSTLDPVGVLMWVDPKIADAVRPYRFRVPPLVKADGSIHMKDLSKNNLAMKVESAEGLDYDLLGKTLRLGKTSADVDVIGASIKARVKKSQLLGGEIAVNADVSIDPKKPVFGAEIDVRRVDFPKLTKLYFDFDTSKGLVSGRYKFTAPTTRPQLMIGNGSIRVEDGNVFAIPLLGPLSDIINKIIPGAGYQTARLATADFRIAKEIISSDNLEIEGAGFSLFGRGDIFFMTDQMDMSVRINARGLPGVVLFPVSKLFEYISTGTVSNPEWRPKIIPRIPQKRESPAQR